MTWEPADTRFYCERHPVGIVDIGGTGHAAATFRAVLESLGAVVHMSLVGTPRDFVEVLGQGTDGPPFLVVSGHGDKQGLVFGEYAPSIDTSMLVKGSVPPECIAKHVDLPGCVVINTACWAGEERMARAFMAGGLKAYIGTVDPNPDGTEDLVFLVHFFHSLFKRKCSVREAWERATSYDEESRLYVLYDEEGCHRL